MRKFLSFSIGLISLLSLLFLGSLRLWAQELVWEEEGQIFHDPNIHNVEVLYVPGIFTNYSYRMYFNQEGKIKSATSLEGRTFTIEEGNRLEEGTAPSVIKLDDGRYRIYYHIDDGSGKTVVKSAISKSTLDTDSAMLEFAIETGVRLSYGGEFDPDGVLHPSVIALPNNGGYRMYYDGEIKKTDQEFTWRILSANSPDGLTWTKDEKVRINVEEDSPLGADLAWNAHARYVPLTGTYELYFGVQTPNDEFIDGIYLATSNDGLLFSDPVAQLTPEEESGEFGPGGQTGSYQDPFVLETETEKRMYYWIQGSGIYSARLVSKTAEEPQPLWETVKQQLSELWEKIKEFELPNNFELYIIPTILLAGGAAAVIYLWRSRIRR